MNREVLTLAARELRAAGVEEPRADAERLLASLLHTERWRVIDAPELNPADGERFRELVRERARRVPLQYLTGIVEFYGLAFHVAPGVLIPRPETEGIVDVLRDGPEPRCIADIGTGSGILAVTLATVFPRARVIATDLSAAALEIARGNAETQGVGLRIDFRQGRELEPLGHDRPDVIVSNPPYVTTDEYARLAPEVHDHEPELALVAGADGLDVIRALIAQAPRALGPGGRLVMEIGHRHARPVRALLDAAGVWRGVRFHADLGGIERVVEARVSGG